MSAGRSLLMRRLPRTLFGSRALSFFDYALKIGIFQAFYGGARLGNRNDDFLDGDIVDGSDKMEYHFQLLPARIALAAAVRAAAA